MKKASKALSVALTLAAIIICLVSVPLMDGEDVVAQDGTITDVDPLASTAKQVDVSSYNELVTALNAASGGEEITLTKDITVPNNTAIQIKDKNNADNPITIDFNGNIIIGNNANTGIYYDNDASTATGVLWIGGSHVVLTDTAPADEFGSKGGIKNSVVSSSSVNAVFVCASKTITTGLQVDGNVSIGIICNTDQIGSENYNTDAKALNVYGSFTVADVAITLNEATVTSVGSVLTFSNKSNFDISINGGYYGALNGQTMSQKAISTNDCLTINGGNFINCKLMEQHGSQIRNHVVVSPFEREIDVLETVQLYGPESYSVAIFAAKDMPNLSVYFSETITDISPYMYLLVSGSQITANSQVTIDGEFGADQGVPERLELHISDGASVTGNLRLKTAEVSVNQGTILPDGFLTPYDSSFGITRDDTIWANHTVYICEMTDSPLVVRTDGWTYKFTSIASALAISGQHNRIDITLQDDIESGKATITNGVGIDLNGHTWKLTGSILVKEGSSLFLSNSSAGTPSTVQLPTGSEYSLGISGGSVQISEGVTVLGNTVLLEGAKGGSLTVYGTIDTTGTKNTPIMGNGAEGSGNTWIEIFETAVIKSDVAAIYHPQSGNLIIHGGTIQGRDGIYIKSGTLDLRDGNISAIGPKADYVHNSNGYVTNGNAITIEACGYPGGAPSVAITGGTVTSTNNQSVAYYIYEGSEEITNTKFITGGTFSSDVSDFMDDSRGCYLGEDGMWITDDAYILTFHSDAVVTIKVRHEHTAEGVPELTPGEGYSASWVSNDGRVFNKNEPVHSSRDYYAVYVIEDVNVTIDQVTMTADGVTLKVSVTSIVSIDDSKTTYSWSYEGSEIDDGSQITVSEPGVYEVFVTVQDSEGNIGEGNNFYELPSTHIVTIQYPDYLGWDDDAVRVIHGQCVDPSQIELRNGYVFSVDNGDLWEKAIVSDNIYFEPKIALDNPEVTLEVKDSSLGYVTISVAATHALKEVSFMYGAIDTENKEMIVAEDNHILIRSSGTYKVTVYTDLDAHPEVFNEWFSESIEISIAEAPGVGEGYSIIYGSDLATVTAETGYDLISGSGVVDTLHVGPGQSFQIQVSKNDETCASAPTTVQMPEKPAAPESVSYSVGTDSIVAGFGFETRLQDSGTGTENWVSQITGLSPGMKYSVEFRLAATDSTFASHVVEMTVRTEAEPEDSLITPEAPDVGIGFFAKYTSDEVTISAEAGYQLSYDGHTTYMTDLVLGPEQTFYVRVAATDMANSSGWTQNMTPARPQTTSEVTIEATPTTIVVSTTDIEFRVDGGDWTTEAITGLTPETLYHVEYRYACDGTSFAGTTVSEEVTTLALYVPEAPPEGYGFTAVFGDDTATITPQEMFEISSDGENVSELLTLGPGGTFKVRVVANGEYTCSAWTDVTLPERPQAPSNPNITAGRTSISASGTGIEICIGDGEWGTTISGLNPGTSYTVQYRLASTETCFAGVAGEVTIRTTSPSGGGGGGTTPTPDPLPEEDTETVTNPDGSSTTTTTRPDGSSTVTTERPDGSSTTTDTKPVTGGTQTTVTETDIDGNTTSTTTTETEITTSTGSTVTSTTVEKTDAEGNTTSTTESTYTSEDESTVTQVTVSTDANGNKTAQTNTTVTIALSDEGTATVSTDAIEEAVNQIGDATSDIQEAEKVISVQPRGDTTQNVQVVMEPEAIRHVADAGAQLEIAGDVGTIKASTDVATSLSQRENPVTMSISLADKTQMAPVIQNIVGDRPTYQLTASSGEDSIHELGGDVTVTIPYILSEGEDPESIVVFYVDDDGILHAMPTTYENGTVTFTTDHFSYYTIHSDIAASEPSDGDDSTLFYVAAAIVAIIVVAAVAVVMRHKA